MEYLMSLRTLLVWNKMIFWEGQLAEIPTSFNTKFAIATHYLQQMYFKKPLVLGKKISAAYVYNYFLLNYFPIILTTCDLASCSPIIYFQNNFSKNLNSVFKSATSSAGHRDQRDRRRRFPGQARTVLELEIEPRSGIEFSSDV
jgi:hypothetical protein